MKSSDLDKSVRLFKSNPSLANRGNVVRAMVSYEIGRTEARRIAAMRETREQIERELELDANADVTVLHARYNELMCA